jgi:hypothetical protein
MMILIFGCACLAVLFAEASGLADRLKFAVYGYQPYRRLKPFDCPLCLAWWLALLAALVMHYKPLEAVLLAAASAILAIFITREVRS